MLNTMTDATFEHKGHRITARRMVNSSDGKFYCWQGYFYGKSIANRSLNKLEAEFIALAEKEASTGVEVCHEDY